MTPSDLRAWQTQMGYTQQNAAQALGVSLATYKRWLVAGPTRLADLACSALAAGLGGKTFTPGTDLPLLPIGYEAAMSVFPHGT